MRKHIITVIFLFLVLLCENGFAENKLDGNTWRISMENNMRLSMVGGFLMAKTDMRQYTRSTVDATDCGSSRLMRETEFYREVSKAGLEPFVELVDGVYRDHRFRDMPISGAIEVIAWGLGGYQEFLECNLKYLLTSERDSESDLAISPLMCLEYDHPEYLDAK